MYVEEQDHAQIQYMTRRGLRVEVEWTPRYCWFLLPSIEVNTSIKEVSFTFLCFGLYLCWGK